MSVAIRKTRASFGRADFPIGARELRARHDYVVVLEKTYSNEVRRSTEKSAYLRREAYFRSLESELARISELKTGWNSYNAPAPFAKVIMRARGFLEKFKALNFWPIAIVASAEGGVAFSFAQRERSAFLELLNSGDAMAAMYEKTGPPIVFEVSESDADTANALGRFREYLK